jgi:hypothetical protein
MLQVDHIVPLPTPLILPEKKVCGSLTACVDVDLILLHCFATAKTISSAKKHTQATPPPATEVLEGRATQGGARAREFLGPQGASKPAFGALCALEVHRT